MRVIVLLVIWSSSICYYCCDAVRFRRQTSQETQQALEALLTDNYDVHRAPKAHKITHEEDASAHNDTVSVNLSIHISSIEKVADKEEEFDFHITLRQNWVDDRLKYNTSEGDDEVPAVVERFRVWTPAISYALNRVKGPYNNLRETVPQDETLSVSADGEVQYDTDLALTFNCAFDETDKLSGLRVCSLYVASMSQTADRVSVAWDSDYAVTASSDVAGPAKEHSLVLPGYRIDRCNDKLNGHSQYSCVSVSIMIGRPDSLIRTLLEAYLPLGMLVLLADLSLWCPAGKRGTRMWIAAILFLVTVLTAVLVIMITPGVRDPLILKCWAASCVALADLPLIAITVALCRERRRREACTGDDDDMQDGERKCHCSCCAWVELSCLERATAILLPLALLLVCIAFWMVMFSSPSPPSNIIPLTVPEI